MLNSKPKILITLSLAVGVGYLERSSIAHLIPIMRLELGGSDQEWSRVLSSFGFGYVAGLSISAQLIKKFNMGVLLTVLALIWGIASIGMALSSTTDSFLAYRFLIGFAEGPLFPIFATWIACFNDPIKRTKDTAFVESSSYIGLALAGIVSVYLSQVYSWRIAFVGLGLVAWLFAGWCIISKLNRLAPNILSYEKPSLTNNSKPMHLVIFFLAATGFLFYNLMKSFFSSWQPTFLQRSYGFSSQEVASFSFYQAIVAYFCVLGMGYFAYRLLRAGVPLSRGRIITLFVGFVGASSIGTIIFDLGDNAASMVIFASFPLLISTSPIIWSTPADMVSTPLKVAYFSSYFNMISNIGTIVSPMIIGRHLSVSGGGYQVAILLSGFALCAFLLFCLVWFVNSFDEKNEPSLT